MARLISKKEELYIDDGYGRHHKVLRGWESLSGWYWFAIEKVRNQLSFIDGKKVPDVIWYGFIQGFKDGWDTFSQAKIESLSPRTWEIPEGNLYYSGRR